MFQKPILVALLASIPHLIIIWLMYALHKINLYPTIIVSVFGSLGILLIILRPFKQFEAIKDFLISLENSPGLRFQSINSLLGTDSLSAALNSTSRLLKEYHDVSERISAELSILLDKIPMPVIQIGSDRRVVRQNEAAVNLLGEAALGKDLVIALRHPQVIAEVDRVLDAGGSSEIEVTLGDPVEKNYLCYLVGSANQDDATAVVIVFSDITDVIRGEQMRIDFVANASHEIRTPLAILSGCMETLSGPAKGDAKAEAKFIELAGKETKRMISLVDDLLSLSEIEANQHQLPSDEIDIRLGLERSVNSLKAGLNINDSHTAIQVDLPEELPNVLGDETELDQVWRNLILNAVKYGEGKAEIKVSLVDRMPPARLDEAAVKVDIIDYGVGIEESHLPRLTERFYRVDSVRSRELGGTGLGLAIVKHVLTRHRGFLEIESEANEGSRFSVYLPVFNKDQQSH